LGRVSERSSNCFPGQKGEVGGVGGLQSCLGWTRVLSGGWTAGRAVSGPAVPWAPHFSSGVEIGPVKPEDTTGNVR